MDLFDTRNIRI